jgi:hypothetical protein
MDEKGVQVMTETGTMSAKGPKKIPSKQIPA